MQTVLFAWLVAGDLRGTPEQLGTAQLCLVLPALLFLLVGGAAADRVDRRRLLARLHAAGALGVAALGVGVAAGWLSYALVIGYALALGTVSAFATPTRDSMLNEVAGGSLMRAVVGMTLTQFVAQALGAVAAGSARLVGTAGALGLQAGVLGMGAIAALRLPAALSAPRPRAALDPGELLEGVREVLRSDAMRPVVLLVMAVGLFFMGPYVVVFPILVRDFYGGGVEQLALLTTTFPIGSIAASIALLGRREVRRKRRALVWAQAVAALCLLAISLGPSFAVTFALSVAWGICGGVFMSTGRTVFQQSAPETHRARVLSVYTLGFMGAGAVGSPLAGLLAGRLGPLGALAFCGVAMLLFVAAMTLFTDVTRPE